MRLNPLIFNKNTNGAINLLQAFKSNVKKKKKTKQNKFTVIQRTKNDTCKKAIVLTKIIQV